MLRATAAAADAYARQGGPRAAGRRADRPPRSACGPTGSGCRQDLRQSRDAWKDRRDQAHARELTARDLTNRRDALAQRVRDDTGWNSLRSTWRRKRARSRSRSPTTRRRALSPRDLGQEIDELRQKIAKLGSVNLEALDELAEVEKRGTPGCGRQFDDLTAAARSSSQQIIDQINADSRRLFTETLAAVRGHFQDLFRKLFGGGMADVVLEDEADVLESGHRDHRPPAGQGTAAHLAALRRREDADGGGAAAGDLPEPAQPVLPAGRGGRGAGRGEHRTGWRACCGEFRRAEQFIIITHKKRTMAAADVLLRGDDAGERRRRSGWPSGSRTGPTRTSRPSTGRRDPLHRTRARS